MWTDRQEDAQFETHTRCGNTHACRQASRHFVIFAWSKREVWHAVGKTSLSASWNNRQTRGFDSQHNFIDTMVLIRHLKKVHNTYCVLH